MVRTIKLVKDMANLSDLTSLFHDLFDSFQRVPVGGCQQTLGYLSREGTSAGKNHRPQWCIRTERHHHLEGGIAVIHLAAEGFGNGDLL